MHFAMKSSELMSKGTVIPTFLLEKTQKKEAQKMYIENVISKRWWKHLKLNTDFQIWGLPT